MPGRRGWAGRVRPRRRRRRWIMALFSLLVLLILLVIGDRVAVAIAESQIASQIKQADSAINPSVNIKGFPFLTQVISRNLQEIDISAKDIPAGSSGVTISNVSAQAKGVHINSSFNGGKVDSILGTAFVSFSSVGGALSAQTGGLADLKLSAAGRTRSTSPPTSAARPPSTRPARSRSPTTTSPSRGRRALAAAAAASTSARSSAASATTARCPTSTSTSRSFRRDFR